MKRLDEIKERSKTVHPLNQMDFENPLDIAITWTRNYWKDTQYLLAKLEIAEKTLEQIRELDDGDPNVSLGRIATEALKALEE